MATVSVKNIEQLEILEASEDVGNGIFLNFKL